MLSSMMRRKRTSILMLFERRIKLNDFQHDITSIVVIILTIIMQVVHVDCGKIYKIKIGKENTKSYL